MKITCQACSAKYTIADDKVRGRKVKIRCKGCGTPIVVDGQQPGLGDEVVGTPGVSEPPPPAAPAEAAGEAPPEDIVWNVNLSDTDSRTMTTQEIVAAWASGVVTSDAYVWKDGMADWVPILDCAELAPLLGSAPAPAPEPAPAASPTGTPFGPPVVLSSPAAAPAPAAAPQHAARLAANRSGATADLFGNVELAGSEQEVVTSTHSLPTAPGSTAYEEKLTGARNENSVLFSLDSLKAGFATGGASPGKAPQAPSPRATQASNPDDPFGMGNTGGVLGGGNPLFSLADNTALLTAPAPPEPPPAPAASLDLGGLTRPSGSPADKKKQMILIGAIAGGVLLVGIVLGLALGGGDDKEAKDESAASANVAAEPLKGEGEKKEEPKAEEKKEEPKPEEKKEEPKPEEKKEEPKPEEKPAETAPKPTEAAKKTVAAKKEEAPAPTTDAPFSKASAISALSSAASQARSCKKPGGPTGSGKVQVTFAPSGRVTTATIMGPPFAGTAVGGCVAGAFKRAKVPAFSGNPVTVQKSFTIN